MAKVTIGVPIYNQNLKYFKESLDSIRNQSCGSHVFEVIVLDDGSDDRKEVEKITKEFGFKYFYQENQGVGVVRQAIVDKASKKTEFICFLSSDDIWDEKYLETMIKTAEERPGKILYSSYSKIKGEGEVIEIAKLPNHNHNHGNFCVDCLDYAEKNNMFVNFSTTFFPRKVFEKVQFNKDLRFCEDLDFLLRSMKHFKYWFIDEVLLKYRVVDNMTSKVRGKIAETNEKIIREVRKYWEEK